MSAAHSRRARLTSEALGSALLLATVVGSGIMAERLAVGNAAIALLCNTLPTGAMLIVLITMLGPISGAHLNPAVSLVFLLRRELSPQDASLYIVGQLIGALAGVYLAHAMFDLAIWQQAKTVRSGLALGFSEFVATFGLVLTILLTQKCRPDSVASSVGLYIVAAYWFTASTSFANPAVTLARACSDTFAGIRLVDVPLFAIAQCAGALAAAISVRLLFETDRTQTANAQRNQPSHDQS